MTPAAVTTADILTAACHLLPSCVLVVMALRGEWPFRPRWAVVAVVMFGLTGFAKHLFRAEGRQDLIDDLTVVRVVVCVAVVLALPPVYTWLRGLVDRERLTEALSRERAANAALTAANESLVADAAVIHEKLRQVEHRLRNEEFARELHDRVSAMSRAVPRAMNGGAA